MFQSPSSSSGKTEEHDVDKAEVDEADKSESAQSESKVSPNEENDVSAARVSSKSLASPTSVTVTEYFVKYKGLSYLHCEWATEEALTAKDKRFPPKLKRFKQVCWCDL